MDDIEKLIYELIDINDGVLIKLRQGCELDEEIIGQFEEVKAIVKRVSERWNKERSLPKELCGIMIDFYPALENCLTYCDKATADKLLMYADEIMDLFRDCCV